MQVSQMMLRVRWGWEAICWSTVEVGDPSEVDGEDENWLLPVAVVLPGADSVLDADETGE